MSKTNSIDRRSFVTRATGAVAGAAALGACAGDDAAAPAVHTQPSVRWRLASSFPRSLDTLYGINDYLTERISQMTDGRFTIRPYPAGEIVPGLQVLDAVQQGATHVAVDRIAGNQGTDTVRIDLEVRPLVVR